MLHSTMLNDVELRCCLRLARALCFHFPVCKVTYKVSVNFSADMQRQILTFHWMEIFLWLPTQVAPSHMTHCIVGLVTGTRVLNMKLRLHKRINFKNEIINKNKKKKKTRTNKCVNVEIITVRQNENKTL